MASATNLVLAALMGAGMVWLLTAEVLRGRRQGRAQGCAAWRRTRESDLGTCLVCGNRTIGYEVHEDEFCHGPRSA